MKKIRKILSNLILCTCTIFVSYVLFTYVVNFIILNKEIQWIYSEKTVSNYKQDLKKLEENVNKIQNLESNVYSEEDLKEIKEKSNNVLNNYKNLFINNYDDAKNYKIIDTFPIQGINGAAESSLVRYELAYENNMTINEFWGSENSLKQTNEEEFNKILNNSNLYNNVTALDIQIILSYNARLEYINNFNNVSNYSIFGYDYRVLLDDYRNIKNMIKVTDKILEIGGYIYE